MLLKITTTHNPATDLGYLLHKNPTRVQSFMMSFGKTYVFYPEATEERCTAALLLDVDPIEMVKGKPGTTMGGPLDQYVNDRPYAASSYLSVAISQVFGDGLQGKCKEKPELVNTVMPFEISIAVLPCRRGGEKFLQRLFEPLGYDLEAVHHPLDEKFPEWGEGPYFTVMLKKMARLKDILTHLYVLIPVLDNNKHYYVSRDEVEKLLSKGEGWLSQHPEREQITKRYLKYQPSLARQALERLAEENEPAPSARDDVEEQGKRALEEPLSLNEERLGAVIAAIKSSGAKSILDLGCGEGKLLRELMKVKEIDNILGMDVSIRSLEIAKNRLHLDQLSPRQKERVTLMQGSLLYRDRRLEGFDLAAVIEVVEHLDPPRLAAFERVLFECARPKTVILTTPNREYNAVWNFEEGKLRHGDHRFEWTREEFRTWTDGIAERFDYKVRMLPVGPEDRRFGTPTQMAIFELN